MWIWRENFFSEKPLLWSQPPPSPQARTIAWGRGGGRQGSRGGYGRNSEGRGRGGWQGSRPLYDGQQHGSNNSLHSFSGDGQSSSSGGQGIYERDRPTCQICQKTGYTAVRCWFRYEESQNSDNRANYASQAGPSSEWILDTGANMHVTSDLSKLNAPNSYHGSNCITVGNGESLNISTLARVPLKPPPLSFT